MSRSTAPTGPTGPTGPPHLQATATISVQARLTIEQAFERFANTVTIDDQRMFHDTRLEHVRNAALEIEQDLAARRYVYAGPQVATRHYMEPRSVWID